MTLLQLLCTTAPETWAAVAAHIPPTCRAAVWAELAGLGLVDDDGPTAKGRRLAAVSQAALRAYDAAGGFDIPAAAPQKPVQAGAAAGAVCRDFETWTAARRAAFDRAGLDCRTPLGEFMARTVSVAVPGKWADCRIFGGVKHGPRVVRVPRAEYWAGGAYPVGLGVVDYAPETEGRAWGPHKGRLGYTPDNAGYEVWAGKQARNPRPAPELELLAEAAD